MLSLHTIHHGRSALAAHAEGLNFVIGAAHIVGSTPNCSDAFVTTLIGGLSVIINILMGLGVAIAVVGIIVGGLMRATAWGSEQRIVMSNKAITCAVIGLVIVLLGVTLGNSIPGWFGAGKCTLPGS
jgi:predicted phage tail protein